MRSFGRAFATAALLAALSTPALGQTSQEAELYRQILGRETALRQEFDAPDPAAQAAILKKAHTLVVSYQDLYRLFPRSGYSDNALWQAATLSADLFWEFGEARDRTTAIRLYQLLKSEYPTSTLLKQVPAQLTRLENAKAASNAAPAATSTPASSTATPTFAMLTSIRREVLPEVLRFTLELEREITFHAERIDGPARVFIDLQNTRAVEALRGATLPYTDDVVRTVRVGLQQGGRTRVVLDLSGAGRYSIYTVYDPYRIVIDFERPMPSRPPATGTMLASKDPAPRPAPAPKLPVVKDPDPLSSNAPGARWAIATPAAAPSTRVETTPPPAPLPSSPVAAPLPPSANSNGTFSLSRQLGLGVARIVIDAGHGGHDPGAKIRGLNEADLTLDVAQRLEKLLSKQTGFEVVMTRKDDTFVPLEERTAIANRVGADLFLSIHVNASPNPAARGIETYFLNLAPNPEAGAIAARENATSSKTMRELPDIVRAIALNNKIGESRDFASTVQASMYDKLRRSNKDLRNLGVKQAPFMVLIGATMPSILAEISFITNAQEGSLLKTEKYRQQVAEALLDGILRYQQSLKRAPSVAQSN